MTDSIPVREPDKGEMDGTGGTFEFFVLNLCHDKLGPSKVTWRGGDQKQSIDVGGLEPATISGRKQFYPKSGVKDEWNYSLRDREFQLNIFEFDRYVVVTISEYGIGVLPTFTAPDTWKW